MKYVFAAILMLGFVIPAFAEDPCPDQAGITTALNNVQQHGHFYFIPLNVQMFKDMYVARTEKTNDGEFLTCVLSQFEAKFNLNVISYQVIRDQYARDAEAYVHGITLKALPISQK